MMRIELIGQSVDRQNCWSRQQFSDARSQCFFEQQVFARFARLQDHEVAPEVRPDRERSTDIVATFDRGSVDWKHRQTFRGVDRTRPPPEVFPI